MIVIDWKKKSSPRNNLYNIHLGKVLVNSSGYGFISIVQVDFMTSCTCADFIVISDYILIFLTSMFQVKNSF